MSPANVPTSALASTIATSVPVSLANGLSPAGARHISPAIARATNEASLPLP